MVIILEIKKTADYWESFIIHELIQLIIIDNMQYARQFAKLRYLEMIA